MLREKCILLTLKVLVVHLCSTLCNPMDWIAPLSVEFSRHEYWSGLSFSPAGDLPDPGIKPGSPSLQADSLPSESPGKSTFIRKKGFDISDLNL